MSSLSVQLALQISHLCLPSLDSVMCMLEKKARYRIEVGPLYLMGLS